MGKDKSKKPNTNDIEQMVQEQDEFVQAGRVDDWQDSIDTVPVQGGEAEVAVSPNGSFSKGKLLIVLGIVLVVLVSAFVAGFFIGKTNKQNNPEIGSVIDLGTSPVTTEKLVISGRLLEPDGTAASGVFLRLQSEPKLVLTDADGYFTLFEVSAGAHTLSVFDENGAVCSTMTLVIEGNSQLSDLRFALGSDGGFVMRVSADVSLVELVVEYDDSSNELDVIANDCMIVTDEGTIVNSEGTLLSTEGTLITPQGGVVLTNGTIILGNAVVTGGVATYVESDETLADGTKVAANGKITLTNGTEVFEHSVKLASGTTVIHAEGEANCIKNGKLVTASTGDRLSPAADLGVELLAYQDSRQWDSTINLFGVPEGEEVPTIYPGDCGQYTFEVKNSNVFAMELNLLISEVAHNAGAIPLRYRIRVGSTYLAGSADTYVTEAELAQRDITLAAGATVDYTLEWVWQEGDDALDTALGSAENRTHVVNVRIYGKQV